MAGKTTKYDGEVKDKEGWESRAAPALAVMAAISKLKPARGASGTMPCPRCGKPLHWSWGGPRAVRATCETPNCLAFMS